MFLVAMVRLTSSPTKPLLVSDDASFKNLIDELRNERSVAVDTEAASYHRYVDRVYLVQISSPTVTAIVDPLAVRNLKPLGKMLSDPEVEILFHDGDYDLRVFDRDYGFHARNLFDSRIAAQLLGESGIGLGPLLNKYFGIVVDKKLQRADWSRRPLTAEMTQYAAADTAHLLALKEELSGQLEACGRLDWAKEEFKRLESVRWTASTNGDGFLRIKGAKALTPRSLSVLKSVYEWREAKAASMDRAPFRVLGNEAMSALARETPTSTKRLRDLRGLPSSAARRYGDELVGAVQAGLNTPPGKKPKIERSKRPKMTKSAQRKLENLKALRQQKAKDLGIEVGVLCPNGTLQAIARAAPSNVTELRKVNDLRRWQCAALGGSAVLEAVNGEP